MGVIKPDFDGQLNALTETITNQANQMLVILPLTPMIFNFGYFMATPEVSSREMLLPKPHQDNAEIHKILPKSMTINPQRETIGINVNTALDIACGLPRCSHETLRLDFNHSTPN